MWERLSKHDRNQDIIVAGTPGISDSQFDENGLAQSHAYTVLGVLELSNGQRLVKIRNPWGHANFHGDWSKKSDLWTEELLKESDLDMSTNDGVFFMAIEDYVKEIEVTMVNFNKD